VLFVDECHLIWGDICGYVWGKTKSRIEIPIKNEKQRQTYYGAINYRTGKVIIKGYAQGNTENTIQFVKYLIQQNKSSKLIIIWDGATYHYSQEFREYLKQVNQGKPEEEWLIRCLKLAPNAPEQNPIEDVWLQGKEMLRRYWNICKSFRIVKWLFEWTLSQDLFYFSKLSMYGSFS
jgi:transposase